MAVGFLYNPVFLEHDTGSYHPESSERLRAILRAIEPVSRELLWLEPAQASLETLQSVHPLEHISLIREHSKNSEPIDADTQLSSASYEAALTAVGAGVMAVDTVVSGRSRALFAAVRPPGHHATETQAMGFCLFNSIAVTARYAQSLGYKKIMIVDFDVHHGNGTQAIFYGDPTVFYFSSHQSPAYPGNGATYERGEGEGEGFTHNFPLPAYSKDEDILPVYEEALLEDVERFKPDMILVSAGYDLHRADPLAQLDISTEGITKIVEAIMRSSTVPKIFMLEGGYDLNALGESVFATIKVMQAYEPESL